jgi:hypothetical protein
MEGEEDYCALSLSESGASHCDNNNNAQLPLSTFHYSICARSRIPALPKVVLLTFSNLCCMLSLSFPFSFRFPSLAVVWRKIYNKFSLSHSLTLSLVVLCVYFIIPHLTVCAERSLLAYVLLYVFVCVFEGSGQDDTHQTSKSGVVAAAMAAVAHIEDINFMELVSNFTFLGY